jgi:asparagine synthase (glutamine-hydrolysing)
MCGIVGAYRYIGADAEAICVAQAANIMRHRGPDGEGYVLVNTATGTSSPRRGTDTPANIPHERIEAPAPFTPDLVLGHRRLSIFDLSPKGHQPMTVVGEQYWLTFNGEIYNYLEIRDELRAKGYTFHTEADTEVLIQAYDAWGVDCLQRFIGMFAFALWDQKRQRLFCVRDHMGIKPFYYVAARDRFAFASEIKAFHVLAPEACTPDMNQLYWFLSYGGIYNAPQTFFEGVRELPGGCYVIVENGRASEPVRWWDVDLERARHTHNYADVEGEFMRLMRDSVRLQLRGHVPVGTCLSGGLDSSTIVALSTQILTETGINDGRISSFSSLYSVKGLDERHYVDLVAHQFNTRRHDVTPASANFLNRVEKITWHQDVPTASATLYTQHHVMQLAQGNVTVLLDGQGGDELFAGYLNYVVYYLSDLRKRDPARWIKEQAQFVVGLRSRFNASLNRREFIGRILHYLTHGRKPVNVLNVSVHPLAREREASYPRRTLKGADALNNYLYQALLRDSIPSLLHYEDRNSMAYGIEARVPFLDHRMVEFALGVPAEQKVRGVETKWFMRRALRGTLPDAIIDRKDKLGYPTPFAQWLRTDLKKETEAFLFDRVVKREWIDRAAVENIWRAHQDGSRNLSTSVYTLITAEMWYAQQTQSVPAKQGMIA